MKRQFVKSVLEDELCTKKPLRFWSDKENVKYFLKLLSKNLNLKTCHDWDSLTQKQIKENGGSGLVNKYSMREIKSIGFPEGKFKLTKKNQGFWNNDENIENFIIQIKEKLNLKTEKDWNLINRNIIKENGGNGLLKKYTLNEIKKIGFPEGKFDNKINPSQKSSKYWEDKENIKKFLNEIKEKYNFNTPKDWNLLTKNLIFENGGGSLTYKYSIYQLKLMACPEGKLIFRKKKQQGYWDKEENIKKFLLELQEKLNLRTFNDWNSLTQKEIIENGGSGVLDKKTMPQLKLIGFPSGNFKTWKKSQGFWYKNENIQNFIDEFGKKFNLNTFDDWNSITSSQIKLFGGKSILNKYSMYEIKCLGFPDGKLLFDKPILSKSHGFWDKKINIENFIKKLKKEYNLQSFDDWNSISKLQILSLGGRSILKKYSMYEIKCLGFPDGKLMFDKPNPSKSLDYWENDDNVQDFFDNLKNLYNLNSLEDWERISKSQILSLSGPAFFNSKYLNKSNHEIEPGFHHFLNKSGKGRSSQRWLFLQIQKLFPGEEIVEDYFHSEISRQTGFNIQFDVFLVQKNIAFEYHGKQHYEDIPSLFAPLEMYKSRDEEKQKLCKQFGIQLIVIPYWWDNSLDSLSSEITKHINIKE